MEQKGIIHKISGPVVVAESLPAKMYDLVRVGEEKLMGEIIQIHGNRATIQVYENTAGLKPNEPVETTGRPLSVELGPGLLGQIYDGVQRPLQVLRDKSGDFIGRGITTSPLDEARKWKFVPKARKGETLGPGDILGTVQETRHIEHRVLVPPNLGGKLKDLHEGTYTLTEEIGQFDTNTPLYLKHDWPVRKQRPFKEKMLPTLPLVTGQRILDTLFPIAKGGTGAIPGPFGSGKTVTQQQLAKWSDADVIVYIGCGERGNEMTEVLSEFPHLEDVRTGRPLIERTILIANTSNMPVAAREASVYTGITLAEYYRDQGYDVALMADSTSRWAEAMREISSRLEEMPGEEGYPAYLATRLAQFYERAGRVKCTGSGNRIGSVTSIGAVSPPGGDFSEPVTQNTLKVTKVFWALDAKLAQRRHFPAINWLDSYSLYVNELQPWFIENVSEDFVYIRTVAMKLLQKEAELQEIVQLVGSESIPEKERVTLESTKLIRQGFLQQNAYHEIDAFCSLKKQFRILKAIIGFHKKAEAAVEEGASVAAMAALPSAGRLVKVAYTPEEKFGAEMDSIEKEMESDFKKLLS